MDERTRRQLVEAQRNELTEYLIYERLAACTADAANRSVLQRIAADERGHQELLATLTGATVQPNRIRVAFYVAIARVFGLSFGLRLMEKGENLATGFYEGLRREVPEVAQLITDEQKHEDEVLGMIEEDRIHYASAMVLGLNDALVELTGALAGLTLALRDGRLIAASGLIMGIAASLSMAASAYLSSREDGGSEGKNPLKSALYTGVAYILTVAVLITPYLLFPNMYVALGVMLVLSFMVILGYNFYITTAKNLAFWRRSLEMIAISLGVAIISFLIGLATRMLLHVDI